MALEQGAQQQCNKTSVIKRPYLATISLSQLYTAEIDGGLIFMSSISDNIARIRENIFKAAHGREVKLLAVSKTFPCGAIAEAIKTGQLCFGENYAQEAVEKVDFFHLNSPTVPLEWHFIGPLQSNKTRMVAEHFQWIQSVDRFKIARRLNDQRPLDLPPLNILVEVNIDEEDSKSGVSVNELEDLMPELVKLPRLRLRGLMCIPKAQASESEKRMTFTRMKTLFDRMNAQGYELDTLSMGMSADYLLAIEEGATLVRVGSSIFGQRNYSSKI